jgi:hypothetical protein
MHSMSERRASVGLDMRSVVIAVVVLLLGAGLGFAGGYKYGHHTSTKTRTTAAATGTKAKPAKKAAKPPAPQGKAQIVTCLEGKGIRYPNAATADFNVPPAGVDKATLSKALGACYGDLLKTG